MGQVDVILRELVNSANAIEDAKTNRNELPWWAWLRTRRMNKLIAEMVEFRNENRRILRKLKESK